jgi:hypothetical protein
MSDAIAKKLRQVEALLHPGEPLTFRAVAPFLGRNHRLRMLAADHIDAQDAEILRLKMIIAQDVSRALGTMQGVADMTGDTALHEAADRLSAAIHEALRGGPNDQSE